LKKKYIIHLGILGWCASAYAICPLCTVALGAGVGFTEWLGIDDTITGLWVGGLIVSLIFWTLQWLNKKQIFFAERRTVVILAYYSMVITSLYFADIIGHPANKLWGVDKLLLGIILGSISFLLAVRIHFYLKKHNNYHVYFPFQKVILPVVTLIILSGIFYFITK
jgi:hypothetical protein